MQELGRKHPGAGFGWNFYEWLFSDNPQPYGSYGNGSAMRASFVGEFFENPEDVAEKAKETAAVSHNHPEGIKGAVVTAMCVHMAIHKKSKEEIYNYVLEQYPPEEYKFSIDKDLEVYQDKLFLECHLHGQCGPPCVYYGHSNESDLYSAVQK